MKKKGFVSLVIILAIFIIGLVAVNTYGLEVTHREFLKSMGDNPQHAYFYITPQAKQQVTIEHMSSYSELAAAFRQVTYKEPRFSADRIKTIEVDLDPMNQLEEDKGIVIIRYVFEKGRWVVADLKLKK